MLSTDYKAFLAFLNTQGYTGQVNEAFYAYLKAQGYSGQLNEMAYAFLTDLGYTQPTLPEKWRAWIVDGLAVAADPYATLLALFDASEPGEVWPVHEDYLFTDTSCTTPVSAVGDEVKGWLGAKYGVKFTQASVSRIPKYARQPVGGWTQQLLQTEDFSASEWIKTNATIVIGQTDPDGGSNAWLAQTVSTGISNVAQPASRGDGPWTFSLIAKKGNTNRFLMGMYLQSSYSDSVFDFTTGTWTTPGPSVTTGVTDLGGGWFELTLTYTGIKSDSTTLPVYYFGPLNSSATTANDTTAGNNVIVYKPMLNRGSARGAYQKRGSLLQGPFTGPSVAALYFDGLSKSMITTTPIDFTGTNTVTVWLGWEKKTKINDFGVVCELSASAPTTNGTFSVIENGTSASANNWWFAARASTAYERYLTQSMAARDRSIVSAEFDLSAGASAISVNVENHLGAYTALTTAVGTGPGTGNFGNHAIYIGARGGLTTLEAHGFFVGALVVLGRAAVGTEFADIATAIADAA